MIQRALLSVSDKRGIVKLARALTERGVEIVSTGGTARVLQEHHVAVTPIEVVTGYPEMLGGRVKTLHPHVHGALLARRDHPDDVRDLQRNGIATFDLIAVNLYPFTETISRDDVSIEEALEQIDIGGVALLRAAAKNYRYVTVLSDPDDYDRVIERVRADGDVDEQLRAELAAKAFRQTARYDTAIGAWFDRALQREEAGPSPEVLAIYATRAGTLRYGENPHQQGALYRVPAAGGLAHAEQLHGKGMSYTNWLDVEGAWIGVQAFDEPAVVVVKHASPCGVATHPTLATAYRHAYASDPVSAFGSVVALNRPVDLATARTIDEVFTEVIVAPAFADDALAFLKENENRRLLRVPATSASSPEIRAIPGGFIIQTRDRIEHPIAMEVVTQREPSETERAALAFAWRAILQVKSNAIVLARAVEEGHATVGIGTGQPSRVDAVRQAVEKAGEDTQRAVLASDAFFPFPDGIEVAIRAGVSAVIQPGGSIRDRAVIAAADDAGIAMVFTGVRHFRH